MIEQQIANAWTRGRVCPHRVNGCCRLAAAIARVPKQYAAVTPERCGLCLHLKQPTLEVPNAVVAIIANNAREGSAVVHPEPPPKQKPDDLPCVHRGTEVVRSAHCRPCQNAGVSSLPVYGCAVHGECIVRGYVLDAPKLCLTCDDRRRPGEPEIKPVKRITPAKGMLFNRNHESADWMGDQFAGSGCVLVCGGPSVKEMDLCNLQSRGVFIASLSQIAATHVRPHAWFSVDKCTTYHEAIWRDPQIMKFVARQLWDSGHDEMVPVKRNGHWEPGTLARKFPNVWYYNRGDEWDFDAFLTRPHAMWCTTVDGADRIKKSVMLVAIRLLHWLGFRSVYLIGCDFHMTRERQYAFHCTKGDGAFRSNNRTYRALNETFARLRPSFEAAGFHVYNASVGGQLSAFERVSLDDAIDACLASFPKEIDVAGLYH